MLTFRLIIFRRKEIGIKAACKLLVKLTPGAGFTALVVDQFQCNVLTAMFSGTR